MFLIKKKKTFSYIFTWKTDGYKRIKIANTLWAVFDLRKSKELIQVVPL